MNIYPSDFPTFTNPLNCSVCYTQDQLQKFALWISTIFYYNNFILNITDLARVARRYKNDNLFFCRTINFSSVNGFTGQQIVLYISPMDESACYNSNETSTIMRILPNGILPLCWADNTCTSIHVPPSQMTNKEQIIYYYYINLNFFVNLINALKNSLTQHQWRTDYCITLVFPEELYPGSKSERTFIASGAFLRQIFNYVTLHSNLPWANKLPAPSV